MGMMPQIGVITADAVLGQLLMELFSDEVYQVWVASDVGHACQHLRITPPDVLVVDPWISGLTIPEVLTTLRAANVTRVPIIALISLPREVDLVQAAGMDAVAKPFDLETLLARVAHYALLMCPTAPEDMQH